MKFRTSLLFTVLLGLFLFTSCEREPIPAEQDFKIGQQNIVEQMKSFTGALKANELTPYRANLPQGWNDDLVIAENGDIMEVGKKYSWDEIPEGWQEFTQKEAEKRGIVPGSYSRHTLTNGDVYIYFSPDRYGSQYSSTTYVAVPPWYGYLKQIGYESEYVDYGTVGWSSDHTYGSKQTIGGYEVFSYATVVSEPDAVPQLYSLRLFLVGSDGFLWVDQDTVTDEYEGFGTAIVFTAWTFDEAEDWYNDEGATGNENAIVIY